MSDIYYQAYKQFMVDSINADSSLPAPFFLDQPFGLWVKRMIRAMHEGYPTEPSRLELKSRLITLFTSTKNIDDPVKAAEKCTHYIEAYLDNNLEILTANIENQDKNNSDERQVALNQNIDELFQKLEITKKYTDYHKTQEKGHCTRSKRPNLFYPHTTFHR